jgi:hypothetical protein
VLSAVQPYETENKVLALPKLLDGSWVHFDWSRAIADGIKQIGLPYSGQYGFVETRMYSAVHHQVVPAKKALGCADCHNAEAVTCTRCHRDAKDMDLPERRRTVSLEVKNRLDFKALGYPDDPHHAAGVGGRSAVTFESLPRARSPRGRRTVRVPQNRPAARVGAAERLP